MRTLLILALGLGLGASAWLTLRETTGVGSAGDASKPGDSHAAAAAASDPADAPRDERARDERAPAQRPAGVPGTVRLPDGSERAALNGVVGAPPLNWPAGKPYAPIVEVRSLPDGLDWFVHADGTMSTTRYMFRAELGRDDATTIRFDPDQDGGRLRPQLPGSTLDIEPADR